MKTHSFLLALAVLLLNSTAALATETDQYYAWGRTLKDSADAANEKFNQDLQDALNVVNKKNAGANYTCEAVTDKMINRFAFFIGKNWPELWANSSPLVDRIPANKADKENYKKVALYGSRNFWESLWDWGVIAGPAPTLRINGVNIGSDKLGHHFVEGGKYYRVYGAAIRKGKSPEEAERLAIEFGIGLEKGKLGLRTSGVFSHGDLESNYQGFRFYRSLCEEGGLEKTSQGWILKKPYEVRDYVNIDWDESFNGSAYRPHRWNKVKRRLLHYCPFLTNPEFMELRKRYHERPPEELSASMKYVRSLMAQGQLLDSSLHRLEAACPNPGVDRSRSETETKHSEEVPNPLRGRLHLKEAW